MFRLIFQSSGLKTVCQRGDQKQTLRCRKAMEKAWNLVWTLNNHILNPISCEQKLEGLALKYESWVVVSWQWEISGSGPITAAGVETRRRKWKLTQRCPTLNGRIRLIEWAKFPRSNYIRTKTDSPTATRMSNGWHVTRDVVMGQPRNGVFNHNNKHKGTAPDCSPVTLKSQVSRSRGNRCWPVFAFDQREDMPQSAGSAHVQGHE